MHVKKECTKSNMQLVLVNGSFAEEVVLVVLPKR